MTSFLSEMNAATRNGSNVFRHQLTTVFYPDEQIGFYRNHDRLHYMSTTPMNLIPNHELPTAAYQSNDSLNHRKRFAEADERSGREDDNGSQMHNHSASHVVFPDDINSNSRVTSIRDILEQVADDAYDDNESVLPSSVPRGSGIRIAGTYRRYRQYGPPDTLATMQSMTNVQRVPATNSAYGKKKRAKDPFSKFKPNSVSDVNLLAMNQVRFAPYTHNKPRPLMRSPTNNAKPKPFDYYYANQNTAESMYNQILWASNNRMKATADSTNSRNERHLPKQQKPFSLMLDVYPMPSSDEEMVAPTRHTPYPNRPPRPIYPMPIDANSINHNLQYASDNSFYNQIKFPQLQSYHRIPIDASPAASNVNAPNPNYYYYRNYMPKQQNVYKSNQFRRPSSVYDNPPPNDDSPSQITVHLNLFPNKKKAKSLPTSRTRNVQVLDSYNLSNDGGDGGDDEDNDRFYKRRMEYEHLADNARISTPVESLQNNYDESPFRSLKSPTITSNWMPRSNGDVNSARNISLGKSTAEEMSPFSSAESIDFDTTTNDDNHQSTNTAKPIYRNQSMATASGRRIFLPDSTQSDTFSKSSSVEPVSIDDVNRSTVRSTLSSNIAHATQQQQPQRFPLLIQTTAITDTTTDEIMNRIKFPSN